MSHIAAGAIAGTVAPNHRTAVVLGLSSHLLLDGVGHDDKTMPFAGQAALASAAAGLLLWRHGARSKVTAGGLAGILPDSEVALAILQAKLGSRRLIFPSHWKRRGRPPDTHPYRFPGPTVSVRLEVAIATMVMALLVGPRRR